MLEWTGLDQLARDNRFAIVAPAAYQETWYALSSLWPGDDGEGTSLFNDVLFLVELLGATATEFSVDPGRTYAVGHGHGAGMLGFQIQGTGVTDIYGETYTTPYHAFGVNAGYDPYLGSGSGYLADPKRPVWIAQGSEDTSWGEYCGEELAKDLERFDFDVVFTMVEGAGYIWLWQDGLGQTNQDLWDWLMSKTTEE